jgi:hypothetical protein
MYLSTRSGLGLRGTWAVSSVFGSRISSLLTSRLPFLRKFLPVPHDSASISGGIFRQPLGLHSRFRWFSNSFSTQSSILRSTTEGEKKDGENQETSNEKKSEQKPEDGEESKKKTESESTEGKEEKEKEKEKQSRYKPKEKPKKNTPPPPERPAYDGGSWDEWKGMISTRPLDQREKLALAILALCGVGLILSDYESAEETNFQKFKTVTYPSGLVLFLKVCRDRIYVYTAADSNAKIRWDESVRGYGLDKTLRFLRVKSTLYFDVPSSSFLDKQLQKMYQKQGTPPEERIPVIYSNIQDW